MHNAEPLAKAMTDDTAGLADPAAEREAEAHRLAKKALADRFAAAERAAKGVGGAPPPAAAEPTGG